MKVASKIRILSAVLALLSAIVVGFVMYWGYRDSIAALEVEVLEQRVEADVLRFKSAFREISHDIRLLEGLSEIRGLADGSDRSGPELKEDLAQTFRQLLVAKPHYVQARLIGQADGGRELVRVDRTGWGIVRRRESELQRKGDRDYFLRSKEIPSGQIYYSEINLNREQNRVEEPHRPMLRVAMPVYGASGGFWGIVVINLDFKGFVEDFLRSRMQRFAHFLCNAQGDYLLHPDEGKTYGFDLGKRYRLQEEYPEFEEFLASGATELTLPVKRDSAQPREWFHLRKVVPLEDGRVLLYGVSARFDEVITATRSIVLRSILIMVVLLVIALVGAFGVSLLITKPIEKLTLAARRLGEGEGDVDLPIYRDDEIGALSAAFEEMRSAIKGHEENILEINRSLSSANEDLRHFAHISSHELREPLTRIAGLSSLLEREVLNSADEDRLNLARSVKLEASNALQQITDFRVFSHLGEGTSVRERTNLGELAREVLVEFEGVLAERGVEVSMDELPTLVVYRNLVKVLYRNLVENALKYTEAAGIGLKFTCERGKSAWVLGVFNSGSAIGEKDRGNVFKVFTRLDHEVDGTGLGLSICKRVVESHKGEIWVDSDAKGVHFKFTLEGNGYGGFKK